MTPSPADTGESYPRDTGKEAAIDDRMNRTDATSLEKTLMGIAGAAEGLAEQVGHLRPAAQDAARKLTESVREIQDALRASGATGARAPATTTGPTTPVTTGVSTVPPTGVVSPTTAEPVTFTEVKEENFLERIATRGADRVQSFASAVSEAADHAAKAPTALGYEVKTATREVVDEVKVAATGYGLAGILGYFSLFFLSFLIAAVLNDLLGGYWGTFLVFLAYGIGAFLAYRRAQAGVTAAKTRARQGINAVKSEARTDFEAVRRPFRETRGGRPGM